MTSKQRAYLRSLANNIDAIFQVGKNGISDNFINQINDALEARELIKISVLETAPEEILEIANILANSTRSEIVQTMGSKITLYRAREKNSKIILPKK
jgi:putative RNA-binding protein, yhbY family